MTTGRDQTEGRGVGAFIVIEGLDGSGKTTQARMLAERLGRFDEPVCSTAEPSLSLPGQLIRQAMSDPTMLGNASLPYLFAADRREHLDRVVLPHLAQGNIVVSDRYIASSLAYQSGLLPMDFIYTLNSRFPKPDLTIFLDAPVEVCLRRIQARNRPGDPFEQEGRLRLVGGAYRDAMRLLASHGHRVVPIDAGGDVEKVHAEVVGAVLAVMP